MNYWESGMHLALGTDIFESFDRYQRRLLEEYDRLADEFRFVRVDARRSVEEIQDDLRAHAARYLASAGQLGVAPPAAAGAGGGRRGEAALGGRSAREACCSRPTTRQPTHSGARRG